MTGQARGRSRTTAGSLDETPNDSAQSSRAPREDAGVPSDSSEKPHWGGYFLAECREWNAIVGALLIARRVLEWRLFQMGQTAFTVGRLLAIAGLLFAIFGLTRWARDWTVRHLTRRSGVRVGVAHAIASIVRYLLVFIGLIVLLETIGIDLSSLMVVAGALGVGIGLGLQGITNNFVSGLILLIERPIKVGDRIEVGDIKGDVVAIAPRATTVVTNDKITVIVPNSHFVSSQVVNWSHGDPEVRISVPVPVAYASDPEEVKRVLLQVAASHAGVLSDPVPDVLFEAFGDSALQFILHASGLGTTPHAPAFSGATSTTRCTRRCWKPASRCRPQRTLHIRDVSGLLKS